MSTKLCIYHESDLDGLMSAAIVRHAYPDVDLYPYQYGRAINMDKILMYDEIYMCDISFPIEEMKKLCSRKFFWMDHHADIIKQVDEQIMGKYPINNGSNSSYAGCILTWLQLFPDKMIPTVVTLLGKYDVFDKTGDWEKTLNFQYYCRVSCNTIERLGQLLSEDFENHEEEELIIMLDIGTDYRRHNTSMAQEAARRGYQGLMDGHKAFFINSIGFNTEDFASSLPPESELVVMWVFTGIEYIVSLRSITDIDVSVIARNHGGNGHKAAAGFRTTMKNFFFG